MMERAWLSLLVLIAVIGFRFAEAPHDDQASTSPTSAAKTASTESVSDEIPAVKMAARTQAERAEARAIEQILARFAVRHTTLSLRERTALAHTILDEARRNDLSPDLVMGVIEVESAGYPLATSTVGALGLMQLLPSTAEELAGKLDIPWQGPDTLFDPATNVRLGTAYLRELADRYNGNVTLALAAYNWGPGRLDRRIRHGKSVPEIYVQQVQSAMHRYTEPATPQLTQS